MSSETTDTDASDNADAVDENENEPPSDRARENDDGEPKPDAGSLAERLDEQIEAVPVDDLIPYQNNPKRHSEEQVKKIADSILEYGYTVPIIIDGDDRIIAGHGRYRAIKGYTDLESVSCIRRDDLSEAQIKAFRLADNRVAESEWDTERLAVEIEELQFEDFDLDLTGFDESELDSFGIWDDEDAGQEDEAVDDVPPEDAYDAPDFDPHFSVRVNFETKEDMEEFADLVGQEITEETDFIYYPPTATGGIDGEDDAEETHAVVNAND